MKSQIILLSLFIFLLQGSREIYAAQKPLPVPNTHTKQSDILSIQKRNSWIKSQTAIWSKKKDKVRTKRREKENDPARLVKQSRKAFMFGLISYLISGIYIPLAFINSIPIFPILGFAFCLLAFIKAVRAVKLLKKNPGKYDETLLKRAKTSKLLGFLGAFVPLLAVTAGLIMLYLYF